MTAPPAGRHLANDLPTPVPLTVHVIAHGGAGRPIITLPGDRGIYVLKRIGTLNDDMAAVLGLADEDDGDGGQPDG